MTGTVERDVAPLQAGDPRRLGPYELVGRLGVGGQGAVFLGRSPSGDRVAVKLLHPDLTQDTDARGRFVREAMAAKKVARFCAAQVLDVQVEGDRPYIVSEYVPGPSLYRLVKDNGPLSDGPLERLAIGTATALVAIHQAGIVHRDLKPANVLVGPDGPRVIDFGIAKALANTATATSRVLGTPAYMSPEQIRGGQVDPSVDVFAWGAMMVFVATGRPPFGTDSIPLVVQRILAAEPDLGGMSEPLRSLVQDCLAKDPAARPAARQVLLRLIGQEEVPGGAFGGVPAAGQNAGLAAAAATAAAAPVGAEVLEQAATIAGIPVQTTAPAQALGAEPVGTLPGSKNEPAAARSTLSRAFVIAGLVAVLVAIAALLFMYMKPYRTSDGSGGGGTSTTTPASQNESTGTGQQPAGNGEPSEGGGAGQASAGTGNSGYENTGRPTHTPTHTPTATHTATPTHTPTWTPTGTPTGTTGGTDEGSGEGGGGSGGGGYDSTTSTDSY